MNKLLCIIASMFLTFSNLCVPMTAWENNVQEERCYEENVNTYEEYSDDEVNIDLIPLITRGTREPNTAYDWNNGNMTFEGDSSTDVDLYSNKYFTEFEEGYLHVKANTSYQGYPRYDVTVSIYRKGLIFDSQIYSGLLSAGETMDLHLENFDSSKKYYLKFTGTFHVTGYVQRTR